MAEMVLSQQITTLSSSLRQKRIGVPLWDRAGDVTK